MLVEQSSLMADSSSTTLPRLNSFISDADDFSSFCPFTRVQDRAEKAEAAMPKKSDNSREKSADKKKGKRDSADRDPSPSPSRDSVNQQSKKNNNSSKKEDDEGKCYTVRSSPSHMAQCSNEQFLSSCLPLLATLSPKKNFLARINIQKALYDAIDEAPDDDDDESEEDCCNREPPRKSQNSSNACNLKGGNDRKKERKNS